MITLLPSDKPYVQMDLQPYKLWCELLGILTHEYFFPFNLLKIIFFFEKYFKLQMRDECSGKGFQRTGWVLL